MDAIWDVGRMSPGMKQVIGFENRSTALGNFRANVGRPIVTSGEFVA